MKSFWKFLLWFVLIIIPVLSYSQPAQFLDSTSNDKSLSLFEPPAWKSLLPVDSIQGPIIIAFPNGTIIFYDVNSMKPLWSVSAGFSISSMYQAIPDGDNMENIYPPDEGMVPYQYDNFVPDIGNGVISKDSYEVNPIKIVEEYLAIKSKDEIKVGAKQNLIKVLDARDGSLIKEFNTFAFPGEIKNYSSKTNAGETMYLEITLFTIASFDQNSGMSWNLTVSDIRAALHLQGRVVPVPVFQFRDITQMLLLDSLRLNNKDRERLDISNNNASCTAVVIAGDTDLVEGTKNLSNKFGLRNIANLMILCFLAILLVCGPWYFVKRQQSTKQINELRGKKTVVPKRKKARKLGSYRKSGNSEKNDDIISPEGGSLKEYPYIMKDGKDSWFQIHDDCSVNGRMVGKLFISNIEIAKGSNGTIVLEGRYDGRRVAVKRLVQAHHDVAYKEIQNLIASDRHPNIVRWYGVECDSDFVYLSLERCACSLNDLIQISSDSSRPSMFTGDSSVNSLDEYNVQLDSVKEILKDTELWKANGHPSTQLLKIMREVVSGVAHLHELGIIHRDLKPQNILITKERSLCAKISDMGISKRLIGDNSSLGHRPTGYGSSGWQAPEQLLHGRQTRAVDLFSLGCVLFYCMTGGKHPFGDHLERDMNIVKNRVDLFMVEHIPEAVDLLSHLLDPNPDSRPTVWNVMNHPIFWSSETRLSFLRDASDRVELEDRENESDILNALENVAPTALGGNWDVKMETTFITNIGRYRRYKFDSMRDLLRVMRNKLNHYRELPKEIQEILGPVPEGFNTYFGSRFPKFLIEVYRVIHKYCKEEEWCGKYLNCSLV